MKRRAAPAAVSAALSGCGGMQSMMDPAGPQAARLHSLTWFFLVLCGLVYIAVLIALALAASRSRQDHTDPAAGARIRRTVIGAVAVTAVLLVVILVVSIATGKAVSAMPRNPLVIDVRGHQWWWEITYPDQVASNTVTTANEIHVPAGRPVMLRLTSDDVIHSFWVPRLHGKLDLIPTRMNVTWIQADQPGVYRGQCAEFCGLQHAHMGLYVVAERADNFDRWLHNQRQPAVEPRDAYLQRGRQVFLDAPCVLCHSIRGTDAFGQIAPDLTHFGARRSIAAATLPNTAGHLAGWITDAQKIKPGNRMPPMSVPPNDLQPLLAYLESLK